MTRDEARAMAALMLDYANGKTVQKYYDGVWSDLDQPAFQSTPSDYRIKPEPKEVWVNEYRDGESCVCYRNRGVAEKVAGLAATRVAVHYREVCDE